MGKERQDRKKLRTSKINKKVRGGLYLVPERDLLSPMLLEDLRKHSQKKI
jgi:hypothetical protein